MEMTGRVTADAKVCTVKDDKQVVNFSVAINDSYRKKGSTELTKQVTFFQCAYWLNPGIAPFIKKGTIVELQGRVGVNAYKDMEGEAKASLNFHVNSIKLHGAAKATSETLAAAPEKPKDAVDDLPF